MENRKTALRIYKTEISQLKEGVFGSKQNFYRFFPTQMCVSLSLLMILLRMSWLAIEDEDYYKKLKKGRFVYEVRYTVHEIPYEDRLNPKLLGLMISVFVRLYRR